MKEIQLTLAIVTGVALLLTLIIRLKLNAFLALLIAAIWVGIAGGLGTLEIIDSISQGMGSTLAFVATIIGLGAIFGTFLEHSGGAQALAMFLLKKGGEQRSRLALLITGFIVAIPVFFDVGLIILLPIVNALAQESGKHILHFALPLITGLAVTHSFIPPTPGPVAVAEILQVDLGYAILIGMGIGLPITLLCGLYLSKLITPEMMAEAQSIELDFEYDASLVKTIFLVLGFPLLLILMGSLFNTLSSEQVIADAKWVDILSFLGHPFIALIIATLLAIYFLGTKRGLDRKELFDVSNKSLAPAGSIILITGAGGVLKTMMINTGIGDMIGNTMAEANFSVILLAYLVAALVRVMQGSATVAMLTAAGIVAAVLPEMNLNMMDRTFVMMAIAAGSVVASHVNDSGFWLVNRYLSQTVPDTIRAWTIQSSFISVSSFILIFLLYQLI